MAKASMILVAITLVAMPKCSPSQTRPRWKAFANRAGWSISYPAAWKIGSCRDCQDPTAPDVFVDFFPPKPADGWVIIEHLENKPQATPADAWLQGISTTANLNPRYREENLTLGGFPGLKVRYHNPSAGVDTESVYVVCGLETFEIDFGGEMHGVPVDELANYSTYLKMLRTLQMKISK